MMVHWAAIAQDITDVYSENGEFFVRTVSFDNELWTDYGKSYVMRAETLDTVYTVDRHFEGGVGEAETQLSNDGGTILFLRDKMRADGRKETQRATAYVRGKLTNSYGINDLFPCDNDTADCQLIYTDRDKLRLTWKDRKPIYEFEEGVSDMEKLALEFPVFSHRDTTYVINPWFSVMMFSLDSGQFLGQMPLGHSFARLDSIKNHHRTGFVDVKRANIYSLPTLANGKDFEQSLAKAMKMKVHESFGKRSNRAFHYCVTVDVSIDRNGKVELHKLEVDEGLDEALVREFLLNSTFDVNLPKGVEKWRVDEYLFFQKRSALVAYREKKEEWKQKQKAYEERITKDSVDGFYIPRNLEECFTQLDSMLRTKDREDMRTSGDTSLIAYHMGLGMYLRNNWCLWAGSRLSEYFHAMHVYHPDDMSGLILTGYYHHLNGLAYDVDSKVRRYQIYWRVNGIPYPRYRPRGTRRAEFNRSKQYDFDGPDKVGVVHFQTNSKTAKSWIYDCHFGWKRLTEEQLTELEGSENLQQALTKLFGKEGTPIDLSVP